ncbi:MAG: cell wall metabolism sensor histidine kinase WalK [Planctomycetota bacterium]|nr:cell wall metabolism sensor histidine kinase WalK [Planctomycetota bacterium]
MRRGKILSILMILFVMGGMACFAQNVQEAWQSRHGVEIGTLGSVLFVLGAGSGLLAIATLRKACRSLISKIDRMTKERRVETLRTDHPEIRPLISAINDMMGVADQCVSDAVMKMKELEIELKVATAQRQHAEAIIYSISDAVLVTDNFDELVLANESAARTFQFDLDKARRVPVGSVINDEKLVELIRDMRQSNSRSGRRIVEHHVKGPGEGRTFKVTLSSVADNNEAPAGVVAVLHDMTREKEVAEMKNDFVSSVSHELRTPLASIKAYVEMLIDGETDDEKTTREFYEVIQNEANRLSRLIDNILNISRIESGLVQVNKQPQSLMVILKEALEVIAPQARLKQINLVEQLTPVFYQTLADKDMLYQAVLNLLSNAVKYTPENGTITVQTIVDESKRRVIARISDTGVGIPPKDLPFVFDKFYRAEANNHMAKGTGLGLSLVKHIVETVHRGRIFVESHIGKGSCFGFELELCE